MTYEEALAYIHSVCWKGSIPGLGRTQELLQRMGNPEKKLRFVHIAGTNGKGSTAAMTASILRQAGYRTGLYTSPFLIRFNERMAVDGEDIPDDELAEITEFVKPHAEAMADHPTEFELVTAIAMEFFARRRCEIVVLEVGMGGLLDSTNVIDPPEVAVITNIGLDHTEFLGSTLPEIAETKSGIIKEGCEVVTYRGDEDVEAVYRRVCQQHHAHWRTPDFDAIVLKEHSFAGQVFDYGPYQNLRTPLLGAHQLKNAAVVLTIVDALRAKGWSIPDQNVYDGIAQVRWPCRFELLGQNPVFIVDGGHNPQCLEALAGNVRDYLEGRDITALTGVLADKDYTDMYSIMASLVSRFVTVTPDNPRALSAEDLKTFLVKFGKPVVSCGSIQEGVAQAIQQAGPDGVVLAFGSLYMAGDIRSTVLSQKK